MAALIRLRRLYPRREGLFRIGGGKRVLYMVALAPLFTWLATFGLAASHSAHELVLAAVLSALAWPVYGILRRRYGGPTGVAGVPALSPSERRDRTSIEP
jgi:hypothetical protein